MPTYNPSDASNAWPEGNYEAAIEAVENKTSQKGNEMQVVSFRVYSKGGKDKAHREYFTFGPGALWKYQSLAKAIGQGEAFKAGNFDVADHIGKTLTIGFEVEESSEYGDQNRAGSYAVLELASENVKAKPQPVAASAPGAYDNVPAITDEDIPF